MRPLIFINQLDEKRGPMMDKNCPFYLQIANLLQTKITFTYSKLRFTLSLYVLSNLLQKIS